MSDKTAYYKVCSACKEEKPKTDFTRNKGSKDGFLSRCKTCWRSYYTNWSLRNGNKKKQYDKDWRGKNLHKTRISTRKYRLKKKYNLSESDVEEIYSKQDNRCAICSKPFSRMKLVVDHCHKTGKVRGLLCAPCNFGIGMLKDDPEICMAAAKYIKDSIV